MCSYVHTNLAAGQISKELIKGTLHTAAYKDAVILTTINRCNQGHAVTLKRRVNTSSQNLGSWYLLDSLKNLPMPLRSNHDWNQLRQGSILAFHQSSVWDDLSPASDLHLADKSFPFDNETFINDNHSYRYHP